MPRRTQAKAPKDSNAPKRPLSSYMVFNKQRMQTLRSEQPGQKITELTKIVGAEWRALTAEQKQPFALEAKELKEKYNVEIAEYKQTDNFSEFEARLKAWKISQKEKVSSENATVDEEDDRPAVRAKAQKRPKDPNAPKKPLTGFFVFQSKRRLELKEANPEKKHTELVKMASEEWKAMTGEEKEPFEAQSRVKKAEYAEAMKGYKESEAYTKFQAVLAAWKSGKASAVKKPVKIASPVRAQPKSSSSESESYSDDSSESPPKAVERGRNVSVTSSEDDDESDVDMGERKNNGNGNRDESHSEDESD